MLIRVGLVCLSILFFISLASGQNTELIIDKGITFYREYEVLSSNKEVKHGHFIGFTTILSETTSILFYDKVGEYKNNIKTGFWEHYYRNTNQVESKGHYSYGEKDGFWTYYYLEEGVRNIKQVETSDGINLEIEDLNNLISKQGSYQNGIQVGVWQYYDESRKLILEYDFDHDSVLFWKDSGDSTFNSDYLGGDYFFKRDIVASYDFYRTIEKVEIKKRLNPGLLKYKFTVNPDGSVSDITLIEKTLRGKKLQQKAFEVIQQSSGSWIAKHVNGESVSSTKVMVFEMDVETTGRLSSGFVNKKFQMEIFLE